ncbi:hypothetical protein L249_3350 [Ophiocordyceps polyrhachis-furcata BCC 54312]|uniref:Uncharacterized protein n=1 Tax=Ophiocordyceps polyrhachis-furcata BCC 54312 TaxID=1330021 RepID=A0A367LMB9_9HYPO|nr:hypothetical protein L249_3350 [Ophiocordyceps polyrhachis-furcata BCC 54312]
MCTYARTVFQCQHQAWGRLLKLCPVAREQQAGSLPGSCALRMPHGLHSRRVPRQCDKCSDLDRKRSLLRAKLDECRELCRRHSTDVRLLSPVRRRARDSGGGDLYDYGVRRRSAMGLGLDQTSFVG